MDTYISGGTREERKKRKDDKKERRRSKRREKRERRKERRMTSSDSDSSDDANIQVYWGLLQRQQALAQIGRYLAKIQQYNGSVAKKAEVEDKEDKEDKSKEVVDESVKITKLDTTRVTSTLDKPPQTNYLSEIQVNVDLLKKNTNDLFNEFIYKKPTKNSVNIDLINLSYHKIKELEGKLKSQPQSQGVITQTSKKIYDLISLAGKYKNLSDDIKNNDDNKEKRQSIITSALSLDLKYTEQDSDSESTGTPAHFTITNDESKTSHARTSAQDSQHTFDLTATSQPLHDALSRRGSFTDQSTAASTAIPPPTIDMSGFYAYPETSIDPKILTYVTSPSTVASNLTATSQPITFASSPSQSTAAPAGFYASSSAQSAPQSLLSEKLSYFYNIFDSGRSNQSDISVIGGHFYSVLTFPFTKEFMGDTNHGQMIFTLYPKTKTFIINILNNLFYVIDTHLFDKHNYNNCTFFSEEDAHYQTHSRFFMYVNGLRILYGIDFLRKPGYIRTDEDNRYYTDFIDNYKKYYDKFTNFALEVPYPIPSSSASSQTTTTAPSYLVPPAAPPSQLKYSPSLQANLPPVQASAQKPLRTPEEQRAIDYSKFVSSLYIPYVADFKRIINEYNSIITSTEVDSTKLQNQFDTIKKIDPSFQILKDNNIKLTNYGMPDGTRSKDLNSNTHLETITKYFDEYYNTIHKLHNDQLKRVKLFALLKQLELFVAEFGKFPPEKLTGRIEILNEDLKIT